MRAGWGGNLEVCVTATDNKYSFEMPLAPACITNVADVALLPQSALNATSSVST